MKKKIPSSIKTELFPIDIFKPGVRVVVVCTSEIAFLFHNFKNTFKFCGNITVHKIRRLKLTKLKYRHLL